MTTDKPVAESPAEETPSMQKVVVDTERIQWYMKEHKILAPRPGGARCGLFLDVDGVLHPLGAYGAQTFCHLSYLFQIIEATGCDIVLSSSWRLDPEGIQEINDRLMSKATLLDVLQKPKAPLNDLGNRDVDIQSWLAMHADEVAWGTRWVALDDLDMRHILGDDHTVLTDGEVGLTAEKVAEAIGKLT